MSNAHEQRTPETTTGSYLPVALFFVSVVALAKSFMESTSDGPRVLVAFMGPAPTIAVLFGMTVLGALWFLKGQIQWPFRKILAMVLFALPLAGLLGTIQGATPGNLAGGEAGSHLGVVLLKLPTVVATGFAGLLVLVTTVMAWRLAFESPSAPDSAATALAQALARTEDEEEQGSIAVVDEPELPLEETADAVEEEAEDQDEEPGLFADSSHLAEPEPEPVPVHLDESRVLAGAMHEETPIAPPDALVALQEATRAEAEAAEARFQQVEARESAPLTSASIVSVDEDTALPAAAFETAPEPEPVEEAPMNPIALAASALLERDEATEEPIEAPFDEPIASSFEAPVEEETAVVEEEPVAPDAPTEESDGALVTDEIEEDVLDEDAEEAEEEDLDEAEDIDEGEDEEVDEDIDAEDLEEDEEYEEEDEDFDEDEEDVEEDEDLDEDLEEDEVEEDEDEDVEEDEDLEEEDEEYEEEDADEDLEEEDADAHAELDEEEADDEAVPESVDPDELEWAELERATRPEADVVARPPIVIHDHAAAREEEAEEPAVAASLETPPAPDPDPIEVPSPVLQTSVESSNPRTPARSGRSTDDWATWEEQDAPTSRRAVIKDDDEDDEIQPVLFAHRSEVDDDVYRRAVSLVTDEDRCTVALLQRSLSVSFSEATAMIERMYDEGLVGPPLPSGRREILAGLKNEQHAET